MRTSKAMMVLDKIQQAPNGVSMLDLIKVMKASNITIRNALYTLRRVKHVNIKKKNGLYFFKGFNKRADPDLINLSKFESSKDLKDSDVLSIMNANDRGIYLNHLQSGNYHMAAASAMLMSYRNSANIERGVPRVTAS